MRLTRIGEPGAERPAIVDGDGVPRDLSDVVDDIDGTVFTTGGHRPDS